MRPRWKIFFGGLGLFLTLLISLSGKPGAKELVLLALEQKELLQVKVLRVIIDPTSLQPVVLLTDFKEERALPVWIGPNEANAIHAEMQGEKSPRPLTHDLLERVIRKVNGKVQRVVITHSKEGVYYATLVLEREGSVLEIDARPSDSLVMALKFKAPIFISKKLFNETSVSLKEQKGAEELYGLSLQELTPPLAQSFSYKSTLGVLVSDVQKGSPAEKDGLQRGDIIAEAAGKPVENMGSFKEILIRSKAPLQVKIFRQAEFISLTLHPK